MNQTKNDIVSSISESIDIPDGAYDKAIARATDLESWVKHADSSESKKFEPTISSQGSFRLGTVTNPIGNDGEYDLDLSWSLTSGFSKLLHSQSDLKELVGRDVDAYRRARNIETAKEEKNRCWRIRYKDELRFHLDGVPCLPESTDSKNLYRMGMIEAGLGDNLATTIADLSVCITDIRRANYRSRSADWLVSNPEGYARWFEYRMRQASALLEKRAREARAASIDDLPAYRWKTPLQRCVQLLKRHRDVMFADNHDSQPISIIITTLAARAYQGEGEIGEAMERIITDMESFVNSNRPRVPNPVNPENEDFAEKWNTTEGRRLQLEQNFRGWVRQAKADFRKITESTNTEFIARQAQARFGAQVNLVALQSKLGSEFPNIAVSPKTVPIVEPAKPWCRRSVTS